MSPPLNAAQEKMLVKLKELRAQLTDPELRKAKRPSLLEYEHTLLKQMYPVTSDQPAYFYAQDDEGFPLHRIENDAKADGQRICPAFQPIKSIDVDEWPKDVTKPELYHGVWPPTSLAELLGDMTGDPFCIHGCEVTCNHKYADWCKEHGDDWLKMFLIQANENFVHGVIAREDLYLHSTTPANTLASLGKRTQLARAIT